MADNYDFGLRAHEARLNLTWNGQNGDMLDPVPYDASDEDLLQWATEALVGGSISGVAADARADLSDFVVDRFPSGADVPYNRVFIRPKTPFGG